MSSILITGGRVIDPSAGTDRQADLLIRDGFIESIGTGLHDPDARRFDATGAVVAPGFIDTPAAAPILSDPERRAAAEQMVPMRVAFPGRPEQMAAILAWCVSPENSLMTGQILAVDGGAECVVRGERAW